MMIRMGCIRRSKNWPGNYPRRTSRRSVLFIS